MDMLEKAARALAAERGAEFDDLHIRLQCALKNEIRAVLEAIREPDEGMVRAAWKAANELTWGPEEYVSHEMCKVAHAASINAILSPALTPKEEVA